MTDALQPLPDGVFAATLTPLSSSGLLDGPLFARHVRWLLANGCDGIVVFGTTGEATSFSVAERMAALDALIEAGLPAWRLMIGVGCSAYPETVALSRHAMAHGVGGLLALPPYYYKTVTEDGLFGYFDRVLQDLGDAAARLYLYHIPSFTHIALSQDLVARLRATYPEQVVGMKDSSGDFGHMTAVRKAFPELRLYAGNEQYLLPLLREGGVGSISSTANLTSGLAARVYARRHESDADDLQDRLTVLRKTITAYPAIPALKALTARLTKHPPWQAVRPPLLPLSDADTDALWDQLAALDGLPDMVG